MTCRILFSLACAFWVAVLPAQDQALRVFQNWDKDGSGSLSKEELPPAARANFAKADKNGDGGISLEEHRDFRKAATARQNAAAAQMEGIIVKRDIDYAGTDNPRQKLDLYRPEKPEGENPLPVIVWIHGGGWKGGDKARAQRILPYVKSGKFIGISVGYRLSDEAQWPSQIHDCKAAIRWIRSHANEIGIDPDRIAVWGSSAGGHLVAMLGTTQGVDDLNGTIGPHTDQPSSVRCVVNFYGPADLLTMNEQAPSEATFDHDAPDSPESRLLGGTLQEIPEKARHASPSQYVSKDDPPMLIVHGTRDLLVPYPQSIAYEKQLEAAGVNCLLLTVEGGGHGGGFGPAVDLYVLQFLENQLLGTTHPLKDQKVRAKE